MFIDLTSLTTINRRCLQTSLHLPQSSADNDRHPFTYHSHQQIFIDIPLLITVISRWYSTPLLTTVIKGCASCAHCGCSSWTRGAVCVSSHSLDCTLRTGYAGEWAILTIFRGISGITPWNKRVEVDSRITSMFAFVLDLFYRGLENANVNVNTITWCHELAPELCCLVQNVEK